MNDIFENYEWQIEVDDSNRIILKSNMQTMGMPRESAKRLADCLCQFFSMSLCLNEATDNELKKELERRGYSGTLSYTQTITLNAKNNGNDICHSHC